MRHKIPHWLEIENLLESHKDSLYYSIFRIVLLEDTAEEIFQETWLKAIEKIDSYDSSRPFAPWLFRIARNLCFDHLRHLKRVKAKEHLVVQENPNGHIDWASVDQEKLTASLAQVPPKFREVLHFRFFEDMDLKEIAYIIRRPVGTVKSRINRGLRVLKGAMEQR